MSHGKSVRMDKFTVVFHPNSRGGQRFAVVVSKKIFKSAVARNRIRRRVYETIRTNLPTTAIDRVFIINSREVATMPQLELTDSIRALLTKTSKAAKIKKTE